MTIPNLKNLAHLKNYGYALTLPTDNTFENLIGNANNSNASIDFDVLFWSRDGTADWKVEFSLYSGAGTPILNHTGVTATTTGTDAVGSVSLGGPTVLPVPASLGQATFQRMTLHENMSCAFKPVGTGSGGKVNVWIKWTVSSDVVI